MAAPLACRLLSPRSGVAAAAAAFLGAPVLPTGQRRPPSALTARRGPAAAVAASPQRCVASMGSSSPPAPASGRNLLVTFDLDGTLLRSASPGGNRAHKLALERSMVAALAGTPHALAVPPSIDAVPHAGSTDPLIVEAVLTAAGVPPTVVAQTLPAILDGATATIDAVMAEEAARAGSGGGGGGVPTVLPGVVDLLAALQSAGVAVGLVTGNLEGIAWAKVRAVGLSDYFGGGGYGSDAPDRGVFLATAMRRAGTGGWATGFQLVESPPLSAAATAGGEPSALPSSPPPPPPRYANVVHVGDAPTDMQAAVAAGARGLGVTTGVFGAGTLWAAGATEVLDGLADTRRVLDVLGV